MPSELITSTQNPKVKRLLALQKDSSLRRECGLFVVEGQRELEHCIDAGFQIDTLFVCPELLRSGSGDLASRDFASLILPTALRLWAPPVHVATGCHGPGTQVPGAYASTEVLPEVQKNVPPAAKKALNAAGGTEECTSGDSFSNKGTKSAVKVFELSAAVYEKVAYRGGTEGVIAEVRAKALSLEVLNLPENPLIVVLESVEKPGNLGAVLRSADAAGADAVLICDPLTDLYNPNLIRASIGAIFTVPCVACSSQEAIAFFKSRGIRILTAQLQDSSLYYDTDMRCGTAIVMGTESTGLSQAWRKAADAHIRIPMLGRLDSLNVSVSAAILLFEAVRQRQ